MTNFTLDPRLTNDCLILGSLSISQLLLVNNALLPWFILVPQTTKTELTDLSPTDQAKLLEEINLLAGFVKTNFEIAKLNIAAIGNIVSQLHIHVVGRDPSDYCWPNVVWGTSEREAYTSERINEISDALSEQLGNKFIKN
jgi:diadenosine tetraphosphate (Ap4A) HIT family hydrolase